MLIFVSIFCSLLMGSISCLIAPIFNEEYSESKALSVILLWPFWWMKWIWKFLNRFLK